MKRAHVPTPNEEGLCDWCHWPLASDRVRWNGAYGHARCVAEHERLVLGDDAGPGLLEICDDLDMLADFLTRLDREAAALGIDRQKLALAVEKATSHA